MTQEENKKTEDKKKKKNVKKEFVMNKEEKEKKISYAKIFASRHYFICREQYNEERGYRRDEDGFNGHSSLECSFAKQGVENYLCSLYLEEFYSSSELDELLRR
ncbi:hypothetical protein TUBRATIS_007350 [Tubulinosema ratisbonensis]|uniref:Uncharacterized protein n=1 Tax=Tubulinosema ratisbonensis TaxID=291195 RepID=A0A437AP25_9MICR|nr:hypothetical protein TUBRATIS_007350 [Tubulinosema ratisbonensis]